jgi:hypothetical protein
MFSCCKFSVDEFDPAILSKGKAFGQFSLDKGERLTSEYFAPTMKNLQVKFF